jgi:hypothetical protein
MKTKIDSEFLQRAFDENIHHHLVAGDTEEVRRQIKRIARDTEAEVITVRRRLQALGLIEREHPAKSAEQWKRAEVLLEDGMPYAQVGKEVGIHPRTLWTKLPYLGVRPKDVGAYRQAKRLEGKLGL